jgi:hypothetical protein
MIGIPSYAGTPYDQDWRQWGFDRITPQPNFARTHGPVTRQRFADLDRYVDRFHLAGVEIELDVPSNPLVRVPNATPEHASRISAQAYVDATRSPRQPARSRRRSAGDDHREALELRHRRGRSPIARLPREIRR